MSTVNINTEEKRINTTLLASIADAITRHPSGYTPFRWGVYDESDLLDDERSLSPELEEGARYILNPTKCGTPACLAGWAVFLTNGEEGDSYPTVRYPNENSAIEFYDDVSCHIEQEAENLLRLSVREKDVLFRSSWPQRWLNSVSGQEPLPIPTHMDQEQVFVPTSEQAAAICIHIAKYGFEEQNIYI